MAKKQKILTIKVYSTKKGIHTHIKTAKGSDGVSFIDLVKTKITLTEHFNKLISKF